MTRIGLLLADLIRIIRSIRVIRVSMEYSRRYGLSPPSAGQEIMSL